MTEIPSVDLNDFLTDDPVQKKAFVNAIGSSFEEIGFVALSGHFLEDELIDQLYEQIQAFFDLPLEAKKSYEIEGLSGQRGYVSFGK